MEPVLISPMDCEYSADFNTWLFQILPAELTLCVFANVDMSTLISSTGVSKTWNKFLVQHENILWKELCLNLWPNLMKSVDYFAEGALSRYYTIDYKSFYHRRTKWIKESSHLTVDITNTEWSVSSDDGLTAELLGFHDGENVRTNKTWIPLNVFPGEQKTDPLVYYYEVDIIDAGPSKGMGLGIGDDLTPSHTIPGWNRGGHTVGYHADNGLKYFRMGHGQPFRDTCYKEGDTIGCGYDVASRSVFFTKNGQFLGVAFSDIPHFKFYPMVGSLEKCKVRFNFGRKPFKFDIDYFYVAQGDVVREQAKEFRASLYKWKI